MIHGHGVGAKYNAIIDGRTAEIYANFPHGHPLATAQVEQFMAEIRSSTPAQFNEWYELYRQAPKKKAKK